MRKVIVGLVCAFACMISADAARNVNVIPCPSSVQMYNGSYTPKNGKLTVKKEKDDKLGAESYVLDITPKGIFVRASSETGFLYAAKTLEQLTAQFGQTLPACHIDDAPRFAYRGMHLDCARHFFSAAFVKKYLDVMAMYKLNRFHWHLTEDQGWRIEIKKYPRLTETGAWRSGTQIGYQRGVADTLKYGGYYTQEEIRDVVSHAKSLGITVIPEIDLPGHMKAALASYPELGCTGGPYEVRKIWGIDTEVMCPGKEDMFVFLDNVFAEICELFPSEYIHIGGDECPKVEWEKCPACQKRIAELGLVSDSAGTKEQKLQNYVTARIQEMLAKRGRKVIGWDEVLEGELKPGATIMSWRGIKGGLEAAERGFDVIMTPNTYCYFDYGYSGRNAFMPPCMPNHNLDMHTVYRYEPYDKLSDNARKHILGVQANLWTEYLSTESELEQHLLPRMLALSEVQWCTRENKNWNDFIAALNATQYKLLEERNYDFARVGTSRLKLLSWNLAGGMCSGNDLIFKEIYRWVKNLRTDLCVWTLPASDYSEQWWKGLAQKIGQTTLLKIDGRDGNCIVITSKYPLASVSDDVKEWVKVKIQDKELNLVCVNLHGSADPVSELERIFNGSVNADKHARSHDWILAGDVDALSYEDNWVYRLQKEDVRFRTCNHIASSSPFLDLMPKINRGQFCQTVPEHVRCDFIFATPVLARRVVKASTVWDNFTTPVEVPGNESGLFTPARHLPIVIEVKL